MARIAAPRRGTNGRTASSNMSAGQHRAAPHRARHLAAAEKKMPYDKIARKWRKAQ